jgi:hypothetical protein
MAAGGKQMHQTTVRFGTDLWASLEREAARLGISAAQYIRDATLTRLAYTEGFHEGRETESLAWAAPRRDELEQNVVIELDSALAVRKQGQLARGRARRAREEAQRLRGERERLNG